MKILDRLLITPPTIALAITAISLAVSSAALANGLSFINYTPANGLAGLTVTGVYASGSNIYAATSGGLSIAQLPDPSPAPGPLPVAGAGAAFNVSRRLRRRVQAAGSTPRLG